MGCGAVGGLVSADDGQGPHFNGPVDAALDKSGNIILADRENHCIRKITPKGVVSTVAGAWKDDGEKRIPKKGFEDGQSGKDGATFNSPSSVALDKEGNIFVSDTGNNAIRKITSVGKVLTVAGAWKETPAGRQVLKNFCDGPCKHTAEQTNVSNAGLSSPSGIAVDDKGNIYIADTGNHAIRKMIFHGRHVSEVSGDQYYEMVTVAGAWKQTPGTSIRFGVDNFVDGPLKGEGKQYNNAALKSPKDVALDKNGNIYVADTGNHAIRKISPADSTMVTVAGAWKDEGYREPEEKFTDGPCKAGKPGGAGLKSPSGVAVDKDGNIYVADTGNHAIRKISKDGQMVTVAGAWQDKGDIRAAVGKFSDGPCKAGDKTVNNAGLKSPCSVFVDKDGNIYTADTGNHAARKIAAGREIVTVAGKYAERSGGNRDGFAGYVDGEP